MHQNGHILREYRVSRTSQYKFSYLWSGLNFIIVYFLDSVRYVLIACYWSERMEGFHQAAKCILYPEVNNGHNLSTMEWDTDSGRALSVCFVGQRVPNLGWCRWCYGNSWNWDYVLEIWHLMLSWESLKWKRCFDIWMLEMSFFLFLSSSLPYYLQSPRYFETSNLKTSSYISIFPFSLRVHISFPRWTTEVGWTYLNWLHSLKFLAIRFFGMLAMWQRRNIGTWVECPLLKKRVRLLVRLTMP